MRYSLINVHKEHDGRYRIKANQLRTPGAAALARKTAAMLPPNHLPKQLTRRNPVRKN